MLKGLDDAWIFSNEGGETWSPFDVVGHLVHGEKPTGWPVTKKFCTTKTNILPPLIALHSLQKARENTGPIIG